MLFRSWKGDKTISLTKLTRLTLILLIAKITILYNIVQKSGTTLHLFNFLSEQLLGILFIFQVILLKRLDVSIRKSKYVEKNKSFQSWSLKGSSIATMSSL